MDHRTIDDQQVIERYVLGRLSAAELELFEEHYVGCERCLDALEAAERLRGGLRGVAAEEAARASFVAGVGTLVARLARSRAALVALLAVFVAPSLLLWRANHELGRELAAARAPQVNLPLLFLSPARSGSAEPDAYLDLDPAPERFVLALEIGPETAARYVARLEGPSGALLWQRSDLAADASGSVIVALPPEIFATGDHRLELAPESGPGAPLLFLLHAER